MGSLGAGCVKLATLGRFVFRIPQGLAVECEAVRRVHETIEHGVGHGRIDDQLMPVGDRQLAGDDSRGAAVPVVDDLQEVAPLLRC